jgi:alkylation response protein AidB-like acyl-CoA dehydrogenase
MSKEKECSSSRVSFSEYINCFKTELHQLFHVEDDINKLVLKRGFPEEILKRILDFKPFSVAIPPEFGGRGNEIKENLALLTAASYESLPLSLAIGINTGLFLQPFGKYGPPELKAHVYSKFMTENKMGGLMITEPGFGSDALAMKTHYRKMPDGRFHLKGLKHWAGLTGMADFWLLTAREMLAEDRLGRDISFFVFEKEAQPDGIIVEELFENLGLYPIPYGRNAIDLYVNNNQQINPPSTGIKMMLDLLHRSRLQFPGMGLGFIKRMLDEALNHVRQRIVGGKSLLNYDQVQEHLANLQSWFTVCSAASAFSSKHALLLNDLSDMGIVANSVKAFISDYMQKAAQTTVQLIGAQAYKLDHIAGRGIIDSRPFQIFEGSNDIMNIQIAEGILKQMKIIRQPELYSFLTKFQHTKRASLLIRELLTFEPDVLMSQRKLNEFGKIINRIIALDLTLQLENSAFRSDLINNATGMIIKEIHGLFGLFASKSQINVIEDYSEGSNWMNA